MILPNGDILATGVPEDWFITAFWTGRLLPSALDSVTRLGCLLDIALHAKFAENYLLYFTYVKPGKEDPELATTAVGPARHDGRTTLSDVKDIIVAKLWNRTQRRQ